MSAATLLGASAADAVDAVLDASAVPMLVYFVLVNTSLLVLMVLASLELRDHLRRLPFAGREEMLSSRLAPGVSVIVAMFNEEPVIVTSIEALLALRYPRHEVIVVDDGSTDGSFEALRAAFDLVEVPREVPSDITTRVPARSVHVPRDGRTRLTVVCKDNSGRADSDNVGINVATEELILLVDADSILEPDALLTVAKPFAEDPTRMVATGGVVRAANGCVVEAGRVVEVRMPPTWLTRIQVVEYLRAFYLGRAGWSRLDALILISGAFGVYRRDVVVEVGGLDAGSIGEDFELVMRVHRHMRSAGRDYDVRFIAEPVCWTEVPSSLRVLRRQRLRWQRGLAETLWKYRRMACNPRFGRVGLLALPYAWLFELITPLVELFGLVVVLVGLGLGVVDIPFALLFLLVSYGYAVLVSVVSVTIEERSFHRYPRWRDLLRIMIAAVIENVGYRQATSWFRFEGLLASLTRRQTQWGTMTRQGFDDSHTRRLGADAATLPGVERERR